MNINKKSGFFIVAVVSIATILCIRANNYSNITVLGNIEALSAPGDPDVPLPSNAMYSTVLAYDTDKFPVGGYVRQNGTTGDCEWTATPYNKVGDCVRIVVTRMQKAGY